MIYKNNYKFVLSCIKARISLSKWVLRINNEKLGELADKLELDVTDINNAKRKVIIKKLQYPFIQLGVFLLSFVTNIFPYKWFWGGWEPTYPGDYVLDFLFVLMNPFHWVLHLGNLTSSLIFSKRIGVKKSLVTIVVISNYIFSALAFFLIHKITSITASESFAGTGFAIMYGVYNESKMERGIKK